MFVSAAARRAGDLGTSNCLLFLFPSSSLSSSASFCHAGLTAVVAVCGVKLHSEHEDVCVACIELVRAALCQSLTFRLSFVVCRELMFREYPPRFASFYCFEISSETARWSEMRRLRRCCAQNSTRKRPMPTYVPANCVVAARPSGLLTVVRAV